MAVPFWRTLFAIVPLAFATLLGFASAGAASELRFFTWADYIAPAVTAKFERETGIHVTIIPVRSEAEYLVALPPGGTGYDLATPVDFQVPLLIRAGALETIDASALPNFSNIDRPWQALPYDSRNGFSVPFLWGTTSFVVDTALWSGDINTYEALFHPPEALKGRISLLIGSTEPIRMGLAYLGLSPCTTDPADLHRVLDLFRPLINPEMIATISTVIPILTDKAAAGLAWNGDALRARQKKPSLRYAYPREGTLVWSDTLVVPKDPPNRAAALAFIDFMLKPENAALQSNFTHYANPIRGSDAFLDQELLDAPEVIVPTDARVNFRQSCDGDVLASYTTAWDALLGYVRK